MGVWGRLMLWLSIVWIAPLLYFEMKNEVKFKKNILIGITMPREALEDEEVSKNIEKFKKSQAVICWALLALAVWFFFDFKELDSMMTSYCLWIDLCIVVPCVPYVTTYKELKKIKNQRGWVKKTEEKVYVDTKAIPKFKEVPIWFFVVCAAACLLPLLWEKTGIIIYICFFLTEITYGICCRYCYRNKAEMFSLKASTSSLDRVFVSLMQTVVPPRLSVLIYPSCFKSW